MRARYLSILVAVACGPKPTPVPPVPVLPGDGDAHVAKPTVAAKPVIDDPWADRNDLFAPPAAQKPVKFELPHVDEWKLANGLDVFVIQKPRLPVVSTQLVVRAGRLQEPRARLGVSEATADMLVKGTQRHSALALAKQIDFAGATLAADATYEATLVSCSALARDHRMCFDTVAEVVEQPSFPDEELAKVKSEMTAGVRARLDDAGKLASAHVQNLLWGDEHVRGWIDSESSVASLHRDDLVAWHKTWFAPNNAMLVITGDVDAKKLRPEIENAFGGWRKVSLPPTPSYHEPGLSGIRIRLVDKPGQTQTQIRIAQFGIKHDDPRFFDMLVWNHVLGSGDFSSRLMKVIRVNGGKTYGAGTTFDRNADRGSFVASTYTRNAEALETTKMVLAEIVKMAKDGPSQEEVDAAIANISGGYGPRLETVADLGAALLGAELHGFGTEYVSNFPIAVGQVDVTSAKRAAAEIIDPRNYVIVLVGDAKDVEPQLKKEGWRYEKVAFTDPISPEVRAPEAPADPKAVAAAKKLIDEAVAAKGGKARLAAVHAMRLLANGSTTVRTQSLPVDIDRVFVVPDKMRIDATLAGKIKITVAVNGRTGWQQQPNPQTGTIELTEMTDQDLATVDFERWREPDLILAKATAPDAVIRPQPDDSIDGKPQAVIKLGTPFDALDVAVYIDKKTKLVTRMAYTDRDPQGHLHTQTDDFGDYRDVNGLQVAFKRVSSSEGRSTALELTKVDTDPKIDDTLFAKPNTPPAQPKPDPTPAQPKPDPAPAQPSK
jgi:zinc protease